MAGAGGRGVELTVQSGGNDLGGQRRIGSPVRRLCKDPN